MINTNKNFFQFIFEFLQRIFKKKGQKEEKGITLKNLEIEKSDNSTNLLEIYYPRKTFRKVYEEHLVNYNTYKKLKNEQ